MRLRRVALATLLALALAPVSCGRAGEPGVVPEQVPDVILPALGGKQVHLRDFRGKILLVDFWATWCGPCKETIPDLVTLQERHRRDGLEVIGISLDVQGEAAVAAFAKMYRMNYTVLLGDDRTVRAFGGIEGIPTSFVVDRRGRIVKRFVGVVDAATYEDVIRNLP